MRLLELSNFECLPGKAGGSPFCIRFRLKRILDNYIDEVKEIQIFRVIRHINPSDGDYVVEFMDGTVIKFRDEHYIWTGIQLYQGLTESPLPGSKENIEHNIIDEFLLKKGSDEKCSQLCEALFLVKSAINRSGNNKPRSTISECLLKSILVLNDIILPESVENVIQQYNNS